VNKDIPALAYIEQQVMGRAAAKGSLQSHVRMLEDKYGLALGSGLFWETRVLSLLYMLILFPKEYWKMDQNDPVYREIEQLWPLSRVTVLIQDQKYGNTIHGFIHRLRNALAHANLAFHKNAIEIWDSRKGQDVYRACMSRNETERFLETVGSIMANQRNQTPH
jgi:hypothetical protein